MNKFLFYNKFVNGHGHQQNVTIPDAV